jgi:L-ascorbate metabolism protein UlaG (beta-lactamase superfamily)
MEIERERVSEYPASLAEHSSNSHEVSLWWLGQAGFAVRCKDDLFLIDPYLSDYLAEKYKNSEFPHQRMMDPPVTATDIEELTAVLCTHSHSDHMDPGTVPELMASNENAQLIIPRSARGKARELDIRKKCLRTINSGETMRLGNTATLSALPAAHETREKDRNGNDRFLGYVLDIAGVRMYHSGDCVLYSGLVNKIRSSAVQVALLPVNGRDEYRRERGIMGNFTIEEAFRMCHNTGIETLIPHHFGMFAFNTVPASEIAEVAEEYRETIHCIIPEIGYRYVIKTGEE